MSRSSVNLTFLSSGLLVVVVHNVVYISLSTAMISIVCFDTM